MPADPHIQYLKRSQIDSRLWDDCIEQCSNGLIYARSFYLDAMADNWDALVMNDYEAVMPLPWRRKWGIRYVYQVPFLQRLGIYGGAVSNELTSLFVDKAVQRFKLIDYKAALSLESLQHTSTACTNFILPLSDPPDVIYSRYTAECKKNIRKAQSRGCMLSDQITAVEVVKMFKTAYGSLHTTTSDEYDNVLNLLQLGSKTGACELYAVKDGNNELIYSAALFKDNRRIYYCMGAPTDKGRQARATYFFIHEIIKKYASQNLYFDFEGSDLPNVAEFYKKFSPQEETYYELRINNLPFPLNLLKQ